MGVAIHQEDYNSESWAEEVYETICGKRMVNMIE